MMIRFSYELEMILEEEKMDTQNSIEPTLAPTLLVMLLIHEDKFLHEAFDVCYSSRFENFIGKRALIFTTIMQAPTNDFLTIAALENTLDEFPEN